MRWKTPWNAWQFPKKYEINDQPSMTIPDQTMSMQEILRRFASGLPIQGAKVPEYTGEDDDMPDMEHMDLAERQEVLEAARDELNAIKAQANAKAAAKREAAQKSSQTPNPEFRDSDKDGGDPAPPKNPKKTRGAGAEPRDEEQGSE